MQPECSHKPSMLIVDDEPNVLSCLERMLTLVLRDWHITVLGSTDEAEQSLAAHQYNVVLLDENMPGATGSELTRRYRSVQDNARFFILTGDADFECPPLADGVLVKPCSIGQIKQVLDRTDDREWVRSKS
jgi:DNA-binding NtrC family response regulator